jgi:hypothetical protein
MPAERIIHDEILAAVISDQRASWKIPHPAGGNGDFLFRPGTSAPAAGNALKVWDDGSANTALPAALFTAFRTSNGTSPPGVALTAANTDIRPEDGLFATNRTLITLGYQKTASGVDQYIGNPIYSSFTPTANVANPVAFALSGTDPISAISVTPFVTLPVGAAPIAFIVNRTDASGLGYQPTSSTFGIQDLKVTRTHNAGFLFSGEECDTNIFNTSGNTVPSTDVAVNPILREPTCGTMNTTEFTNFNIYDGGTSEDGNTQELGIFASTTNGNPLHIGCTSGSDTRYRAVGTGDEVNAIKNTTGSETFNGVTYNLPTENQIGYIFFSYEATSAIANSTSYFYLTLDGVDGIDDPSTSTTHELSACGTSTITNCEATHSKTVFTSYPHLRDGTYRSWSEYRVISNSTNKANAQPLVNQAEHVADFTLPDFVPFSPVCAATFGGPHDIGLAVYREHYLQSSVSPNDGPLQASISCKYSPTTLAFQSLGGQDPLGVNNEVGGDVGGAITSETTVPGATDRRQ